MTKSEAIALLNLMLEPGQDRNNEALRIAVRAIKEQIKTEDNNDKLQAVDGYGQENRVQGADSKRIRRDDKDW